MHDRHRVVCETIMRIFKGADIVARYETKNLVPGTQERPADILLPVSNDGRAQAIDVTVIQCCNDSARNQAIREPDYVLNNAVRKKEDHYTQKLADRGISFSAFALDVYGQMHKDALKVLERTASFESAISGEAFGKLMRDYKFQIQAAVNKEIAAMIHVRG